MSSSYCRGGTPTSPCDCEEYTAPEDTHGRAICQECGHGKSKHPKPGKPVGDGGLTEATPTSGKLSVLQAFESRVASTEAREAISSSFNAARDEVLKGYRPGKLETPSASSSNKKKSKKVAKSQLAQFVQVSTLVCLLYGIDAEGNLKQTRPPSRTEEAKLEQQGCAILRDNENPNSSKNAALAINPKWTHEEVTAHLRATFPRPFHWAEKQAVGRARTDMPVWVLINKQFNSLDIAPHPRPTGGDLIRYKGNDKSSIKNSHIYIALRSTVPSAVTKHWLNGVDPEEDNDEEEDDEEEGGTLGEGENSAARPEVPDVLVVSDSEDELLRAPALISYKRKHEEGKPMSTSNNRESGRIVVPEMEYEGISDQRPLKRRKVSTSSSTIEGTTRRPVSRPVKFVRPDDDGFPHRWDPSTFKSPWSFGYNLSIEFF